MTPGVQGKKNCKFSMTPLSRNSQKRLKEKETKPIIEIWPESIRVRLEYINFIYWQWAINIYLCLRRRGENLGGRRYCPPHSPHSKCLCVVSQQRKTEEQQGMGFLVLAARKIEQKWERGERGRTLPPPRSLTHPILCEVFDSCSLFLALKLQWNLY